MGVQVDPTSPEAWPFFSHTSHVLGLCFGNLMKLNGDTLSSKNQSVQKRTVLGCFILKRRPG